MIIKWPTLNYHVTDSLIFRNIITPTNYFTEKWHRWTYFTKFSCSRIVKWPKIRISERHFAECLFSRTSFSRLFNILIAIVSHPRILLCLKSDKRTRILSFFWAITIIRIFFSIEDTLFGWGSKFWITECRTTNISEIQNYEYQNNERWIIR